MGIIFCLIIMFILATKWNEDAEANKKEVEREERLARHASMEAERIHRMEWEDALREPGEALDRLVFRLSFERDFREEVAKRVSVVCATVPGMENMCPPSEWDHDGRRKKESFARIASMIYYAQFGQVPYFFAEGYVHVSLLNDAFRWVSPRWDTYRSFFKWYEDELRQNGFPYPEIKFLEVPRYNAELNDFVSSPYIAYFVQGPTSIDELKRKYALEIKHILTY